MCEDEGNTVTVIQQRDVCMVKSIWSHLDEWWMRRKMYLSTTCVSKWTESTLVDVCTWISERWACIDTFKQSIGPPQDHQNANVFTSVLQSPDGWNATFSNIFWCFADACSSCSAPRLAKVPPFHPAYAEVAFWPCSVDFGFEHQVKVDKDSFAILCIGSPQHETVCYGTNFPDRVISLAISLQSFPFSLSWNENWFWLHFIPPIVGWGYFKHSMNSASVCHRIWDI